MNNKFPYILATKTIMGSYKETVNTQEATHVILSVEEYNKNVEEINKYIEENNLLTKTLKNEITDKEFTQINRNRAESENKKLSAENQELKEQLKNISQECKKLEDQNATLSRINRQNSNKLNGKVHPKTNPGYTFQGYLDWTLKYKYESSRNEIVRGHKITLSTPYSLDIEVEQAKEMIEKDLLNIKVDGQTILTHLCGDSYFYEKTYVDVQEAIREKKYIIAETILQNRDKKYGWAKDNLEDYRIEASDYVAGRRKDQEYEDAAKHLSTANAFFGLNLAMQKSQTNWEATLYCTHDIQRVPDFLLPSKQRKKK